MKSGIFLDDFYTYIKQDFFHWWIEELNNLSLNL